MSPAALSFLSHQMDQLARAERVGIDLRLLRVVLARAEAMKLQADDTFEATLRLAQAIHDGKACPVCWSRIACGCGE